MRDEPTSLWRFWELYRNLHAPHIHAQCTYVYVHILHHTSYGKVRKSVSNAQGPVSQVYANKKATL